MLANRVSSNDCEARAKAEGTRKRHKSESQHLEQSQKRVRRSGVDYDAEFGKGWVVFIFVGFLIQPAECIDSSPAPVFTPLPESRKEKTGKRKKNGGKKAGKLDVLSLEQRQQLQDWIKERSMPKGQRNLAASDIINYISDTFAIQVGFLSCLFYFFNNRNGRQPNTIWRSCC